MGVEFELKYAATPEKQDKLLAQLSPVDTLQMCTTYFDTPDHALSARHITLRLRQENNTTVCTVKTPLPDGSRGEWECFCENIEVGVSELCKLGAPLELLSLTAPGLQPVCGAVFTRRLRLLDLGECTVEIALDRGFLMGGGNRLPLCEVEVELKSGSRTHAAAYGSHIAKTYDLQPESRSKFRRALALARGEEDGV